jgi:hypothetical protein
MGVRLVPKTYKHRESGCVVSSNAIAKPGVYDIAVNDSTHRSTSGVRK